MFRRQLVIKSPLIGAYCPSCCWSHSESLSRWWRILSFVVTNMEATLSITCPKCTPLPPWCGVPMNNMPYVVILIDRCSSYAPCRAASEWIKACLCQHSIFFKACSRPRTVLRTIPPKLWATKIMGRVWVCFIFQQNDYFTKKYNTSTFVIFLFKHRSEIRVLAWS